MHHFHARRAGRIRYALAPHSPVSPEGAGYRRGLVLGLTMAEIMLLLVFCLLIAAAVIFKRDGDAYHAQSEHLAATEMALAMQQQENKRISKEITALESLIVTNGGERLTDQWKKVIASAAIVKRFEEHGVSAIELDKAVDEISVVHELLKDGLAGAQIVSATKDSLALQKELAGSGLRNMSKAELSRLAALGRNLEKAREGEHDWPPIINLSEAKGYSFSVGRAELSSDFRQKLITTIASDVLAIAIKYRANVVEVIGHTDEQTITPRPSNLDQMLISALGGKVGVETLIPGDNVGLGMARAVSVAGILRADQRFKGLTIIPLSGAQLIQPGDVLSDGSASGDIKERRRIEIRIRRPEVQRSSDGRG